MATRAKTKQPRQLARPVAIDFISLSDVLSFRSGTDISLTSLNVLIGPNGSGKSNLLAMFGLLRATTSDLDAYLRANGGVTDWISKAKEAKGYCDVMCSLYMSSDESLFYRLAFLDAERRLMVLGESVEDYSHRDRKTGRHIFYDYDGTVPKLKRGKRGKPTALKEFDPRKSIFAQRRDPELYPELTRAAAVFSAIRMYRSWSFGPDSPLRRPAKTDLPNDFLREEGDNLGLILNRLKRSDAWPQLLENLRSLYEGIEDIDVSIEGGTVQVFLREGGRIIPATRLSDGTLRWLALLCILLHPNPPPLVCIEEPELGLHPDLIATLARLLRSASERMQLIVTTHSDSLVDALGDTPESIVVCDKVDGATQLKRLDRKKLKAWLEKYSLGTLWRSGEIGGNRW